MTAPEPPLRLLTAAFVAPMDGPLLRDAAVACRGDTIVALGDAKRLRDDFPEAAVDDLGASILLPGLVNAHTHLELSLASAGSPPRSFADWLLSVIPNAGPSDQTLPAHAIAEGVAQCLRFGVTSVGDISANPAVVRPLLVNQPQPIGGVWYGEVRAMAQRRGLLDARIAAAGQPSGFSNALSGISPHAPYSIEPEGYAQSLSAAKQLGLPITTHLAESRDEARFLAAHEGPFRELWRILNAWDDAVPRFQGGPIRFAKELGLIDHPTSLAHVNYCDDDELAILATGRASVVYCPRTHAYFGHPPHRWREMRAASINVAVGTDSCASSPDLNLVDELRLLHRIAPEVPVEALWQLATTRAAAALEMGNRIGSLAAGKRADLVCFPANGTEPLREILEDGALPLGVWIGGERIVASH